MAKRLTEIRCAVIGYGGTFNMGRHHATEMERTDGMKVVAVCDIDPQRLDIAKADFPHIGTYRSVDELLTKEPFDLAVIVTPHNTHAPLALKCLKAGKHVIVEKPMCLTVKEATAMMETAKQKGVMLTVYHNRHWDGDFLALQELLGKDIIGKVFHLEMWGGGYGQPGAWWRSDKKVSGGLFYDWGAHYLWWLLQLVPERIHSVAGFFHKLKWYEVTNEDHVQAVIRFANGTMADVEFSTVAAATKPRWFILGTDGAIVSESNQFRVHFFVNGYRAEMTVPYKQGAWGEFYRNVSAHLLLGEGLVIKPQQARRVIAIMETAEKSAKQGGKALPVPYE